MTTSLTRRKPSSMIFCRCLVLVLCLGATVFASPQSDAQSAVELARKNLAGRPRDSAAHLDLAIALGKLTDFSDNRTKLTLAREIRQEAEIALQLDSKNAEACRILGRWHEGMARLNPVLRTLAGAIYGKLPEASIAQAGIYFRRAVALDPEHLPSHADLARWLGREGDVSAMQLAWKRVLSLPARDAEDRVLQAEARAALD